METVGCLLDSPVKSADNPNPVRQNRQPSGTGETSMANKHAVTTDTDKYYTAATDTGKH